MKRILIMAAMMLALAPAAARADPLIEGAMLCTEHFPRNERQYAIPAQLLSAIAVTESGRYHKGLGIKVPWPWTIDTGGKSYFYKSKESAIAVVRKLQARGVRNIDVGCMQVNLQQHPHAFRSLEQAFDPRANVAYAASFLSTLYQQEGSWRKAAAYYHSRTPNLGRQYVSEVYDSWYRIISKLRAARLAIVDNTYAMLDDTDTGSRAVHARARPRYQPVHMNSITLSQYAPSAGGGITVHQDPAPIVPPIEVKAPAADHTPLIAVNNVSAAESVVPVAAAVDPRKNGPTFIFSD